MNTKEGAKKVGITNKKRYGADYYQRLGRIGGKIGRTGGFASKKVGKDGMTGLERAKIAGRKGGQISRRIKK